MIVFVMYSNNLLKRLVKTPKMYFYDTGLVFYLTKWSSAETLESGDMNGAILENYVVLTKFGDLVMLFTSLEFLFLFFPIT